MDVNPITYQEVTDLHLLDTICVDVFNDYSMTLMFVADDVEEHGTVRCGG